MNRKIGIVANHESRKSVTESKKLIDFLEEKNVEYYLSKNLAKKIGQKGTETQKLAKCDFIVTIGGDGTILRTLQKIKKTIPIIGINTGEVGFLTKLTKNNYKNKLNKIIKDFEVEKRSRLSVTINKEDKKEKMPPAINEVVIATSEPAKLLKLRVLLDNKPIEEFRADGLVIATPTGSTAYSMSAGGPIVDPKVEAFILVPLAPYKLSARPFVVPNNSNIKVELLRKGKTADLVVDGQKNKKIKEKDTVIFKESKKPALFIKTKGADFYSKVKEKLV